MNLIEFQDELEKYINYAKCRVDRSLCGTLTWNVLSALSSFSEYLESNPFPDTNTIVLNTRKINGYTLENDFDLGKEDVGLSKVENFAPNELPVSDETQEALDLKVDTSVFNTQLGLKASKAEVILSLAMKANTSDVVLKSLTINGKPLSAPITIGINDVINAGTSSQFLRGDRTWSTISYNDLTNRPVLFSGNYNDLSNKPSLFSGNYSDLQGLPTLFSGSYNDLSNRPVLFSGAYADLTGKPTLFSGDYNDLTNKPSAYSLPEKLQTFNDSGFIKGVTNSQLGAELLSFAPKVYVFGAEGAGVSALGNYMFSIIETNGSDGSKKITFAGNSKTFEFTSPVQADTLRAFTINTSIITTEGALPVYNNTLNQYVLYLAASGNLGIGYNVDRGYKLDVNGTGAFSGGLEVTNAISAGSLVLSGGITFNATSTYDVGSVTGRIKKLWTLELDVNNNYSNISYGNIFRSRGNNFQLLNNTGTRMLTVFENGNAIIGTAVGDNTYKLTVEGATNIGGTLLAGRLQISGNNTALTASNYFSAFVPSVNLELTNVAPDPAASNENAMVVRGRFNGNDTLPKRISYLLKLSSESGESKKMGGMMLESLNAYGNSPNLFFLTDNEKRMQIMSGGNARFYGGQYSTGNALVYTELTSNDLQFMRSDGASYITQLNNQSLVIRVMNGATTANQLNLAQSGTSIFSGAVQFPTWRTSSASTGSNIRNSTNTSTLVTFFDNGNVRIANDTVDTGYKLQVVGESRFYNTVMIQDATETGFINLGGILIGKAPFQQTRFYGALEIRESLLVGTTFPNNVNLTPSAILEVNGTTGGFLLPRMLATNMNAIASPATGLMVYQTDGSQGIYYRTSTAWEQLVSLTVLNAIKQAVPTTKTTSTTNTLTASDYGGNKNLFIRVDASAGAVTITLPASSTISGFTTKVIKVDNSANAVTIKGNGSELINGANTRLLTDQFQSVILENDGTKSYVF